jgi:hypothetical protein
VHSAISSMIARMRVCECTHVRVRVREHVRHSTVGVSVCMCVRAFACARVFACVCTRVRACMAVSLSVFIGLLHIRHRAPGPFIPHRESRAHSAPPDPQSSTIG